MRNIFLDCGTHKFEGLRQFIGILGLNKNWIVHCFEANPTVSVKLSNLINSNWDFELNIHECGVSDRGGDFSFQLEKIGERSDGQGSRLSELWNDGYRTEDSLGEPLKGDIVTSKIIRLSDFLKENITKNDYVVIKLDIEGSEFEVLEDLIVTDTYKLLSEVYVEWHERFFPDIEKYKNKKIDIINKLKEYSVIVHEWH